MQAIISIKPQYINLILSGKKTVEIRSRKMNIPVMSKIWIYATSPIKRLIGYAYVEDIKYEAKDLIWKQYNSYIGISKDDYDQYSNGRKYVTAIFFSTPVRLSESLSLSFIKENITDFHPPQFYKIVNNLNEVLKINET